MQNIKVLIADDDSDYTALIREYFHGNGLSIIEVNSGRELVSKALSELPHVILLDLTMPGLSGYQTCRALKADERIRNIPVIMLTAWTSYQDKLNGFLAGAHRYITKPCDLEDIRNTIYSAIGNNGAASSIARDIEMI